MPNVYKMEKLALHTSSDFPLGHRRSSRITKVVVGAGFPGCVSGFDLFFACLSSVCAIIGSYRRRHLSMEKETQKGHKFTLSYYPLSTYRLAPSPRVTWEATYHKTIAPKTGISFGALLSPKPGRLGQYGRALVYVANWTRK
jgi:hypothetical protein